ncbi:ArsR/SmtB family transcription factor [Pseudonocardia nigra]|uniref:ArsR/SmtB family transcription factor n=1 Tax=Pseudonocardia nigra TaxID=1921578 RepID=UPI001C5EB255|nr:winged helix-turn-helix domain-containing protein [Pseudonocardia nigra]
MSRVRIDPRAAVRVTFDPYSSALACAGARDRLRGIDSAAARVAQRFSGRSLRAVSRIVAPGSSVGPDCLSPADMGTDTDVRHELDRLRGLSAAELHDDLDRTYNGAPPPQWQRIVDDPTRWSRDLADALDGLWAAVEPVWRREEPFRSQKAERVGAAATRRALDVVLAQAHPRGHTEDGTLVFPDPEGTELDATDRVVVLAPVMSRLDVSISNLDHPDLVWLAYPVAGAAPPAADPDGLDALLTPARSRLLRHLDGEWAMSGLARAMRIAPSAATHQVDALVAAGLVTRRREGRRVLVRRTSRGDGLLQLYGGQR